MVFAWIMVRIFYGRKQGKSREEEAGRGRKWHVGER
jgi:hypothetical protein